jgi:general stress protein 26
MCCVYSEYDKDTQNRDTSEQIGGLKMSQQTTDVDNAQLLREKIKDVRIAMMTTTESDGTLRSRPMVAMEIEADGDLWFFTQASTPKVDEVEQQRHVNLSYSKVDANLFVSVSGTAALVRDRQKIKALWKPMLKAWFPKGEDDPDLALLKVTVKSAEYWDAPSGKMGILSVIAKGLVSGGKDHGGEHQKMDLK